MSNDYYSYGEGIQVGLAYGHMFNKSLGLELGVSHLFGSKQESVYQVNDIGFKYKYTIDVQSKMIIINPSLIYVLSQNKLSPFMKFGISGTVGKITMSSDYGNLQGLNEDEIELSTNLDFGITSAFGASYSLSDNLSILGKVSLISSSISPKKMVYTKSTLDGEDQMQDWTKSQKEVVFADEVEYDDTDVEYMDENQPS